MPNNYYTHVAIIVPAHERSQAANRAAALSGNAGDDTPEFFAVALSADGLQPATHYGCQVPMRGKNVAQLPSLKSQFSGSDYLIVRTDVGLDTEQTVATFDELATSMGLQRIEVQGV